jgi:hypothetical protein
LSILVQHDNNPLVGSSQKGSLTSWSLVWTTLYQRLFDVSMGHFFLASILVALNLSVGLGFQPTHVLNGGVRLGHFSGPPSTSFPNMGDTRTTTTKAAKTTTTIKKSTGGLVVSASAASAAETEEWTKKRIHNTKWFRSMSIFAVMGLAGAWNKSPLTQLPTQVISLLHLLSYSIFLGTNFYTTFIAGITMFQNLPRQMFGKLQAKLFPKYFSLSSIALLTQVSVGIEGANAEIPKEKKKRVKGLAHCHALFSKNLTVLPLGTVSLPRCTIDSYLEGSPL